MREQTDAKETEALTEEEIEGIYIEHEYKIENIPGYAEAEKRLFELFGRLLDGGNLARPHDQEEFDKAMADLWMIEMEWSMKQREQTKK
jgi:hypothetical protein